MQPVSEKLASYRSVRDELYVQTSRNYDIRAYKEQFLQDPSTKNIIGRRKMEKISTLSQLVSEFENRMLIFPDKRGIKQFLNIVVHIRNTNSANITDEYFTRVQALTNKLRPEDAVNPVIPAMPLPSAADVILMPRELKEYLVQRITDSDCGQDGQHLILALGKYYWDNDDHRQRVGVKQGDFDRVEREEDGDYQKTVMKCLTKFERNCQRNAVTIDVTQHVIDLLKNEQVFSPPYKKYVETSLHHVFILIHTKLILNCRIAKELKKMKTESSI